MNATDFTFLLNKPDAVNDRQTAALEEIVAEFPYFQSARALRLKGLYNQNSFQYNYALKITAAYTTDRSVLFDFITSDTFTAIHKGMYEQKLAELHGIEVRGSEVIKEEKTAGPTIDTLEQSILSLIKESETPFEFTLAPEEIEIEEAEITPEEITPEEIIPEEITPDETIEIIPDPIIPGGIQPEDNTSVSHDAQITAFPDALTEKLPIPATLEEKLEIGKPLEFSKNETHSFQEWLQLSRLQPIDRDEPVGENSSEEVKALETDMPSETELEKIKKTEIINRFIETNPKIPPVKKDSKPAMIPAPKEDQSALMTETLARVYLEQKKYQKAIQAYEILILKYPEKSTFFADRISEIKNLQQNNT